MGKNNFRGAIPLLLLLLVVFTPSLEQKVASKSNSSRKSLKELRGPIFSNEGDLLILNKTVRGTIPANYRLDVDLFGGTVKYSIDGVNFKNWTSGEECPYKNGSSYYFQPTKNNQKIQLWLVKN